MNHMGEWQGWAPCCCPGEVTTSCHPCSRRVPPRCPAWATLSFTRAIVIQPGQDTRGLPMMWLPPSGGCPCHPGATSSAPAHPHAMPHLLLHCPHVPLAPRAGTAGTLLHACSPHQFSPDPVVLLGCPQWVLAPQSPLTGTTGGWGGPAAMGSCMDVLGTTAGTGWGFGVFFFALQIHVWMMLRNLPGLSGSGLMV